MRLAHTIDQLVGPAKRYAAIVVDPARTARGIHQFTREWALRYARGARRHTFHDTTAADQ